MVTQPCYRAKGLDPLARQLAINHNFVAKELPGTQQLRQLMGHCQFGARVVHGDCLFITISPNPQMSGLVLRLSRYRASNPYVQHGSTTTRKLATRDYPRMEAKRRRLAAVRPSEATSQRHHGEIEADVEVDIPIYDERLSATARDPLAGSVERKGARTTGTNMLAVIARIDVNTASSHHVTSVGASMKGRHLYQRGGLRKGSGIAICASSRCNRLCTVRKNRIVNMPYNNNHRSAARTLPTSRPVMGSQNSTMLAPTGSQNHPKTSSGKKSAPVHQV